MNKNEQDFFRLLCDVHRVDASRVGELAKIAATPEVLGQLFFNRMQGTAFTVLKSTGHLGTVTREFRNSLEAANLHNTLKNDSFYKAVRLVSDALKDCSGKYAMLKGAVLCGLYPRGCRTSNDIDLLVRPRDVTFIGKKLYDVGFRQGSVKNGKFTPASRREIIESKMLRGETVPYILKADLPYMPYIEVDINFSSDYKNSDGNIVDKMLFNAIDTEVMGVAVTTLGEYDFLIHLCAHLYKEATTLPWVKMKRDMTLYKSCDIYLLLEALSPAEVGALFLRAGELGAERICAWAVIMTSRLFECKNRYAAALSENLIRDDKNMLHKVISPVDRKTFVYSERDILKRFFSNDRAVLLSEVAE